MPTVPIEQNRVGIADITTGKLQAADTSGTGLQAIGVGLQNVGEAGARYAKTDSDLHMLMDEAAAKHLDVKASAALNGILYDGDDAFFRQQGFNAVNAQGDANKALDKLKYDLTNEAANDRQKQMFAHVIEQRLAGERTSMARYAASQVVSEARDQSMARRQSYAQDARRFADDPMKRDASVATGLSEVETQGHHEGWSDARMQAEKAQFTSNIYGGIVEDKLTDDPRGAMDFMNAHADSITPERESELRRSLHGPLRERQAFDDVQGMLGGAPTPSTPGKFDGKDTAPLSSTSAVASKIIGAESQLNANARNPVSSASGLGQFTRKTFVDLYTQSYGAGDKTPEQIWSMRFDPKLSRNMTELLVTQNADMLKKAGAPVTDTTLYLAHFLGPRAAAVVKADPTMPIASLVPAQFVRDNPTVLGNGKTAGDVVSWADQKMGGNGVRPTYVPQREDLNSLYQQIDKRDDWSFDRKQAAREQVDHEVAREDNLVSRREKDAERSALDQVTALGDKFTSMTQLGVLATQMSPEVRSRLTDQARQNAAPKPIAADGDTSLGLHMMALADPEGFKQQDLRTYRHMMTPGEWGSLATLQVKMKNQPNDPDVVSHGRIWGMISRYAPDIGLDMKQSTKEGTPQRQDAMRIFSMMQTDLASQTEGKRQPSDNEIKSAFDRSVMTVKVQQQGGIGSFGYHPGQGFGFGVDTVAEPRFKVPDATTPYQVAVPNNVRDRIMSTYRSSVGRVPTEAEIARTYVQHKGTPGFWN